MNAKTIKIQSSDKPVSKSSSVRVEALDDKIFDRLRERINRHRNVKM